MGLLNWLKKKLSGDNTTKLTFDKGQEEFAGLNLKQVLDAHLAWNDRLTKYLDGTSQENLDVHQIAPDNLCILGKWIYGPGQQQFNQLIEFKDLRDTHKGISPDGWTGINGTQRWEQTDSQPVAGRKIQITVEQDPA